MKSRSFNVMIVLALLLSLLGGAVTVTPARAASIVVNSNADNTTTDGLCTLREAITNANNDAATYPDCTAGSTADTITFAADYTITLTGSQLPTVNSTITINGNGAARTIIQASSCDPINLPSDCAPTVNRVFQVSSNGNCPVSELVGQEGGKNKV